MRMKRFGQYFSSQACGFLSSEYLKPGPHSCDLLRKGAVSCPLTLTHLSCADASSVILRTPPFLNLAKGLPPLRNARYVFPHIPSGGQHRTESSTLLAVVEGNAAGFPIDT